MNFSNFFYGKINFMSPNLFFYLFSIGLTIEMVHFFFNPREVDLANLILNFIFLISSIFLTQTTKTTND